MKTTRFATVVQTAGTPQVHLLLAAPKKDPTLQAAIRAERVMTVMQDNTGSRADRGEVGFHEGGERQYLIFPRSLRKYRGAKVVGVRYELLQEEPARRSSGAKRKPQSPPQGHAKEHPLAVPASAQIDEPEKEPEVEVVARTPDEPDAEEQLRDCRKAIKEALRHLQRGNQVAAF